MTIQQTPQTVDAIVIGAGFGGIFAVHKMANEHNLSVIGFDKAGGPGGTWYWNRYPGAQSDTESHFYRYSFDKEMLQEDTWENNYVTQPEILEYAEGVLDRFDLWQHFRFSTEVTSAMYLEDVQLWEITAGGDLYRARYVINGLGLLSAINFPDIPGMEKFEGEILHTGAYPADADMTGKRVGVVGSGSTGVQVVTDLGPKVKHLTHFIRTPQYSVPTGKRPVTEDEIADIKGNYDVLWDQVKNSSVAFGFVESTIPGMSVSEKVRNYIYEDAWQRGGGFRFMFGTFGDIATDEAANESAAAFIRGKIREIVKDPEKARKLTPHDLYARRPLCDNGFYETFNRKNVDVVALKETPIREITKDGVVTEDGTLHELDVLIFATGFDAVDGNYRQMDIRGRDGIEINEHWAEQPTSYLGVMTSNFPNWFMILGPNGPFTNLLPALETQVEWISELIGYAEEHNITAVEPTSETEAAWTKTCEEIANATVFAKVESWIFGANVPGKKHSVLFYLGGMANYRALINQLAEEGYPGFNLSQAPLSAAR